MLSPTTDALQHTTAAFTSPALLLQAPTFNLASSAPTQPPAWSLGPGTVSAVPPPQPQATPTRVNGNVANAAALANAHANVTPARSLASGLSPMASPVITNLAPPPEGIYRSFDDLLSAVQRVAKDNGYGIVKLRASNYRDAKPTRYDLVCDRGGVKYSSTAKKRNPSTRKVDCPFRAKAVCEVSLSNQWRFVVQEARHNHEARIPAATPGQETTPMVQNLRNMSSKMDRVALDVSQGFQELNSRFTELIEKMDARLTALEERTKGLQNMDNRLDNVEARVGIIESRSLDMPLVDDVDSRMLSSSVM